MSLHDSVKVFFNPSSSLVVLSSLSRSSWRSFSFCSILSARSSSSFFKCFFSSSLAGFSSLSARIFPSLSRCFCVFFMIYILKYKHIEYIRISKTKSSVFCVFFVCLTLCCVRGVLCSWFVLVRVRVCMRFMDCGLSVLDFQDVCLSVV